VVCFTTVGPRSVAFAERGFFCAQRRLFLTTPKRGRRVHVIVTTETFDADILIGLTASVAAVGTLHGTLFGLFTNNITPTKTIGVGIFTEPTYTGYARIAATWGAPTRDANKNINIESQLLIWQETGTPVPTTVFGWFLVDSTGLILYMAELFATPQSLVDVLSALKFNVEFIGSNANPGQATIVP
jgi:hypothetical protein